MTDYNICGSTCYFGHFLLFDSLMCLTGSAATLQMEIKGKILEESKVKIISPDDASELMNSVNSSMNCLLFS